MRVHHEFAHHDLGYRAWRFRVVVRVGSLAIEVQGKGCRVHDPFPIAPVIRVRQVWVLEFRQ